MAKDYASIYNSENDSSALEQRWYIKEEVVRGTLESFEGTDFLYTQSGGTIEFAQPFEPSPHRSGRHQNNIIKQKKTQSWNLPLFINIDETQPTAGTAEVDTGVRVLWKSLLGNEDITAGPKYTSLTAPDITFSLYEVGDKYSNQARGCFCQDGTLNLPGDGQANVEFSGNGKDALLIGIGSSSVDNNGGNTVTVVTDDGKQFEQDGLVMIIMNDGTTRSTDTPDGSPRMITDVTGDVITLDGAALTDADGSGGAIYLSYYEPETPVGIDNPIVGLRGNITIASFGAVHQCVRDLTISMTNGHELVDYCFGTDSLDEPFFVPGDRFTANVSMTLNLNKAVIELLRGVKQFEAQDVSFELGDNTSRFFSGVMPKIFFPIPPISVPDSGSIPIEFSDGLALQTALDAADEIELEYK